MSHTEWLIALLIAGSLGRMGALPKTVPLPAAAPYVHEQAPLRIGVARHAQAIKIIPQQRTTISLEGGFWPGGADLQSATQRADYKSALPADAGRALWARAADGLIRVEAGDTQTLCRRAIIHGPARVYSWGASTAEGSYGGALELSLDAAGAVTVVNLVPLEAYLEGVVGAEMPLSFHREALKAQAIIARTYALFNTGRHAEEGFDLCAEVHCQVYRGRDDRPAARAAVGATAGRVLAYRGCLAETVYHSTCGGATDDAHRVWPGYLLPYLRGRCDLRGGADLTSAPPAPALGRDREAASFIASAPGGYCDRSSRYRWGRTYTIEEAQRLVEANLAAVAEVDPAGRYGRVLDLIALGRSDGGRVQTLRIETDAGGFEVKRNDIRWLFGQGQPGPGGLPSTLFVVRAERAAGSARRFVFEGAGWGHGLGLCQWGAHGRAQAGASARAILEHYYPDAQVVDLRGITPPG